MRWWSSKRPNAAAHSILPAGRPAGYRCSPFPATSTASTLQGCLALIRDGATLARGAADVLEALGRLNLSPAPKSIGAPLDPASTAVLQALEEGPGGLDAIVASAHLPVHVALSALAMLELDGSIESRGAGTYARVGVPPNGEEHAR